MICVDRRPRGLVDQRRVDLSAKSEGIGPAVTSGVDTDPEQIIPSVGMFGRRRVGIPE